MNEQFGYGYDASHNLAFRTNNTLLQAFTSNAKDELASIVREGTLTVSGSVTGAVTSLGVNGTNAAIYSDGTFATTNGLTLNNGNNLFVTAGSNSGGALVVSTRMATKLPVTVNPVYDLNGNLLSDGLKGYEYDDANQLTRVTVTNEWRSEFVYDGLGRRRISKEYSWSGSAWSLTNEVRYVWDGMAVLQERDNANTVKVTYTRGLDLTGTMQGAGGIGGLLARTDSTGTAYYHSDAGGNVTTMTDSSGNVVARYLYDPFGNLLAKSGSMADKNTYRFSSKEVHPNSGLYYYGYRFYEPNLQRWLNEDPIGIAGGMNLHRFVGNSPINAIDLFGLVEPRFNPIGQFFAGIVRMARAFDEIVVDGLYPYPHEISQAELNARYWEKRGLVMPAWMQLPEKYDESLDPRWLDVALGAGEALSVYLPAKYCAMGNTTRGAGIEGIGVRGQQDCVKLSIIYDAEKRGVIPNLSGINLTGTTGLPAVESAFGRSFTGVNSADELVSSIQQLGAGARGLVNFTPLDAASPQHMFNFAVSPFGRVRFLDSQASGLAPIWWTACECMRHGYF